MNKKIKKQNKARAFSLSFGEGWGGALILIIIITISSCRKYPEGGSYFIGDMDKKITGEYKILHYYINNIDYVDYYFDNLGVFNISYYKSDHKEYYFVLDNYYKKNNYYRIVGDWYWESNKKEMKFKIKLNYIKPSYENIDTLFISHPLKIYNESVWQIKRLKDNELFIETDFENKNYRFELKKY